MSLTGWLAYSKRPKITVDSCLLDFCSRNLTVAEPSDPSTRIPLGKIRVGPLTGPSVYRICDSPTDDKPLIAMEIGVSQRLKKSASQKQSMEERAAAWLLSLRGITNVVVLIDLAQSTRSPDTVTVTVQVWRQSSRGVPSVGENHTFAVARDASRWLSEADVPKNFPGGINFYSEDIYTEAAQRKEFLLPMLLLRGAVWATGELHLRTVESNAATGCFDMVDDLRKQPYIYKNISFW